jgi:GNAT superfamily N-acetyltransferase
MSEKIRIEALSKKTLNGACKLTLDVFHPNVIDEDYPPRELKISLDLEKNKKACIEFEITYLKYWVALNNRNKVVGIIGLYTLTYDEGEAYWLGWYCVDPKFRRKNIGKLLLNFAIDKAKKEGKKWLRLYTSNAPNEKMANKIYDKLGFKPIKSKKINKIINSEKNKEFAKDFVYRELKLQ